MFELTVNATFSAAHALVIQGTREPLHGHDWHVTATLSGDTLDEDGLLCDFHTVERTLRDIVAPFNNQNLNDTDAFNSLNPSAENVAKHIATCLADQLDEALAPHARITGVRVTEAPGCAVTYFPAASHTNP